VSREGQDIAGALYAIHDSLVRYASAHQSRYESPIGHDGVLGECWLTIAKGLVGLLNGETGSIDCGRFDGAVRELARASGFTQEEADTI
jgi:hypothetical protein